MNLERTRDDLLLQLHETNPETQRNATLKDYFEPVMQLSDTFFKQISFILQRVLDTVRYCYSCYVCRFFASPILCDFFYM